MIEITLLVQYLARIGLSMALGLFIGYEREGQKKPAGVRDVALVTLGATLCAIISLELVNIGLQFPAPIRYDLGRIIAYTIVAIGFLGSGVIIQNKKGVEGITTSTMLWSMVAVGLLCGIGQYVLAIVSEICIYFILKLKHITISFEKRKNGRKRCRKIKSR